MKYIVIGGVAGGATAAARMRRIDEQSEILLFEKGKYISYANCGLPYYIGDTIRQRDKLFIHTPQSFGQRFRIDVRTEEEVIEIDPNKKQILIRTQDGTTYNESYDKLLLSPGAQPVRPNLPGINSEGIFTLRNVVDTDAIKAYIGSRNVRHAAIVGAGFIGLEMAENLHQLGIEVSIIEMGEQVMSPIDFSMASLVHQHLVQQGVSLHLKQGVERFDRIDSSIRLSLQDGSTIETDLVILSIGVRPESSLAEKAGLTIGETGGIAVNKYLQTSDESIYAVGDAIEYPHPLTDKPWTNYLAGPANRQGRIAANNLIRGNVESYEGSIGTAIAKVFDLTVASTGLPAKRLKQIGIPYLSSTTHSGSHAGYYPRSSPISIKLTFSPHDGKLFGAQAVGMDGIDKRIDQIALLIKLGGTIHDLTHLEQAYAPPYSSAKDPVAIAGYVAENILDGTMKPLYWRTLRDADLHTSLLLDVRTAEEYALGHIDGSTNIPLDSLRNRLSEIPKDQQILLYCQVGLRGYLASQILRQYGYSDVSNLSGGYKIYLAATNPIPPNAPSKLTNKPMNEPETDTQLPFTKEIIQVDACGLQCPGPILKMKTAVEQANEGDQIEMIATDAGFVRDAQAWCNLTGNRLISQSSQSGQYSVLIEKQPKSANPTQTSGKGKSFILFSDDLDRALATFVLANGATTTGEKVTIFFTFWGLNVIKKEVKPKVKKDLFAKMFSMMLPSSSRRLALSKMNMLGAGREMMRYIMKNKNIDSLEALRTQAINAGVEFIACQMSMDVMGVDREELLDNCTIGGVATYMERADQSSLNLFI